MFQNIRKDILRHCQARERLTTLYVLRAVKNNFGLQALLVYRFGISIKALKKAPVAIILFPLLFPLYWILMRSIRLAYGIDLSLTADIGPGLYIGHFGGIRVSECSIGEMCTIGEQVELRGKDPSLNGPDIGKNVWIGGHVKVIGNFKIGDAATIGSGAIVTHDIPSRSLALGNPARVINTDYDNKNIL